jgi:hypothetical protein
LLLSIAGPQVPSTPDCLSFAAHAWQNWPVAAEHALSQHTPSTQNPVAQSWHPATLQSAPAA